MATIKQTVEFVTRGEQKAKNALKALSREQRDLINEFRTGNKTFEQAEQGLRELASQYENAEQGAKSLEAAVKSLRSEQRLAAQTQVNEDRFDTTSRQVALAGDVQSNLGALSGLAGAAGAGGAAQGIGLAGELVVLTEELPRLKEAVKGLPAAANAAGQALGLGGGAGLVGAMAATAVAVGVVSFAFKQFQGQFKELKSIVDAQISGIRAANDFVIGQAATTEQITARIADLNRESEATAVSLDRFKSALADIQSGQSALSDEAILGALGLGGIGELKDVIAELEGESVGASQEIAELENFLGSSTVAANEAAAAEEALAAQREQAGQAILAEAAFAGELVALQQESAKFNEEELATKRLGIEQTIAQTQAELQLLEARNNGSEAIANQIEALKTELGQLDESLALLDSAQVKSAAASNSAKEAEEELRKERERAAKSTRTSATTEKKAKGGGFRIGGSTRGRTGGSGAVDVRFVRNIVGGLIDDINGEFEDGSKLIDSVAIKDLGIRDIANDFAKAANQAGENLKEGIYDIRQSLIQGVEDLRIGQSRDIEDARRTGSILAIRDIARNTARAGEDLNRQAKRDSLRIERDYNQNLIKIQQERQQQILQAFDSMLAEMASKASGAGSRSRSGGFSFSRVARS